MTDHAAQFQATKSSSALVIVFVPSHDRFGQPIDQDIWVDRALEVFGTCFGGATAFPRGRGGGGMTRRAGCSSMTIRS
jgi:hypothetical protein